VADYFREKDMNYRTAKLMFPAIVRPQTDTTAARPLPTTFGELLLLTWDIVPRQSQILQETSRPGISQMRLGSEKHKSHNDIRSHLPDAVANSSPVENAKTAEPVSFDTYIQRH